jgi:excinuclease UvrABC ATPase subunit
VVVIVHNLEVTQDRRLDHRHGPGRKISRASDLVSRQANSGDKGGEIIAAGPREEVARAPRSYTGQFLAPVLARSRKSGAGAAGRARSRPSPDRARSEAAE